MSVADVLEASIAVERRGGATAAHELDTLLENAQIEPAPVTVEHLEAARRARRHFGKGIHPAALNFGERFTCTLAGSTGEPLPFKGEDFTRTDIEAA